MAAATAGVARAACASLVAASASFTRASRSAMRFSSSENVLTIGSVFPVTGAGTVGTGGTAAGAAETAGGEGRTRSRAGRCVTIHHAPASASATAPTAIARRAVPREPTRTVASLVRDGRAPESRTVGGADGGAPGVVPGAAVTGRGSGVERIVGDVVEPGGARRPARDGGGVIPAGAKAATASAKARHVGGRAAGILREGLREHRVEAAGQAADARRQRRRRVRHVLVHERKRAVALERRPAAQDLVRDDRQRVAVRRGARGMPLRLLGRHVDGRAHHDARRREARLALEHLRDAEVCEEQPVVLAEEHVRGLHVAVQHARGVRGVERVGELRRSTRTRARAARRRPSAARAASRRRGTA